MAAQAPKAKTLSATGPVLIVILVIVAAILGYYQIIYYPSAAPSTISSASVPSVTPSPHNATVYIPVGAASAPTPQSFLPDTITVVIGYNSTVVWVNNDTVQHTITANANVPDPRFNAFGPQNPQNWNIIQGKGTSGYILNFTFTTPGTYGYYCSFHANMKGTVIVKAASGGGTTNASTTTSTTMTTSGFVPTVASLSLVDWGVYFLVFCAVICTMGEALLARSFATLTGSGIAPWRVNLSRSLLDSFSLTPAALM